MEKIDISKKHQNNLEDDSVLYYQKETKEVVELLQKGNANISRKITRIPFYRLEKLKKIEEEKLKNIHKTEKKKEKDIAKIGKGHDHPQVERRRYKKTKKQKELEGINNHKEKEINIIKESNKIKNIKIEENEYEKEKIQKKQKINSSSLNISNNKNNIINEHNKIANFSRNYSDFYHDLKYNPTTVKFSKRELRISKKQQKIQYPEYTLSHFLSKENKSIIRDINMKKRNNGLQKKTNNSEINKNKKININNSDKKEIKDKNKLIHENKQNIKKINSEKKIKPINLIIEKKEDINNKERNISLKEDKNIITEENENEIDKESEPKKSKLKLLRKKHKRMNKYKKAILKFRLTKKKALCDAVEKDNEQMFFSNTFNADESINNVINNVLNNNIITDDTINNNNNNITNNDMSIISENNIQDKSQINNKTNLSNKYSPILSPKKIENNQSNSILNYYSYNNDLNNITINSNNNKNENNSEHNSNKCEKNTDNNIPLNNNYININSNQINNFNVNNNPYFYYYYPYAYINQFNYNYNTNSINNKYDLSNNNSTSNNYISMNNSLPLPNYTYDFPKLNLKKEKIKEKKLNNYKENLKIQSNALSSLNLNSINGKELTSLIKENKNIDKTNILLINSILPEEEANSFVNKYEGLTKAEFSKNDEDSKKNNNIKPIREYVDQILDKNFEKLFSNFIIKLRDIYYKKKSVAPLKAKKRIVAGMREIEKYIKLNNLLLLFVVPYIEKVEGVKNSMDERILEIFKNCRKNKIPIFFGLTKFKLGQIARKKIASISMLGIINVEGMENELKNIIKIGNELRQKWYEENYEKKQCFKDNKFINEENFEYYQNMKISKEIINK